MSNDNETNENYDWHTDTELGLDEQIKKTKAEQPVARKQAKARRKQEKRIAKKKGKLKKEQERLERIKEGTDTFCDRHPKICKAGKVAAVAGAVATSPIWTPDVAVEYAVDKIEKRSVSKSAGTRTTTSKTKSAPKRTASTSKGRTTSQRASTTSSKARTTAKRTASTSKGRTTPKKAQKPTQKRTTTKGTAKSTPKKKSPKKPRSSDWWGYGDAGL